MAKSLRYTRRLNKIYIWICIYKIHSSIKADTATCAPVRRPTARVLVRPAAKTSLPSSGMRVRTLPGPRTGPHAAVSLIEKLNSIKYWAFHYSNRQFSLTDSLKNIFVTTMSPVDRVWVLASWRDEPSGGARSSLSSFELELKCPVGDITRFSSLFDSFCWWQLHEHFGSLRQSTG